MSLPPLCYGGGFFFIVYLLTFDNVLCYDDNTNKLEVFS